MHIAAIKLTFQIVRQMGLRPWSWQTLVLLRLILSTARRTPNNPWIRLTKHEKVMLAAETLAEGSRARESIADALEVSLLCAWTFQRQLPGRGLAHVGLCCRDCNRRHHRLGSDWGRQWLEAV
jgi:hypothetical protein